MAKMPKSWTIVTPFSRLLALALFIILPFLAFLWGANYQANLDHSFVYQAELQSLSCTRK